jgi:DNA-binding response OmpR family regulator
MVTRGAGDDHRRDAQAPGLGQRDARHSSEGGVLASELKRILVVDDDPFIRRLVRDKLDLAGFEVLAAASGQEALTLIERSGLPHLAIVDINMPGMDGFEFCRIVQAYTDLPVIMLTAVDEEETIIRGIEQFAEDYITKPFSPRELVARTERVLRRIGNFAFTLEPLIKVDDGLAVDFSQQQAVVDGESIALTPTETKLLYILMRNAGRTVTTDFLLRRLWPLEEVYEDALRVHIHRLRKKIQGSASELAYITTERGTGYRFAAGSTRRR